MGTLTVQCAECQKLVAYGNMKWTGKFGGYYQLCPRCFRRKDFLYRVVAHQHKKTEA